MAPSSIARSISRFLATPGKIAHQLDWTKSSGVVLSLHLGKSSIDLAVTAHPSTENPIQALPSIPVESETKNNQKVLKAHILEELSDIVKQWKVCGLVVSWPVQKEGWCGAPCGRVLHTLDQIVQETRIVSKGRQICLWDGHHFRSSEDEWGRVALYSVPTSKEEHRASQEQYREDGMVAADIAEDYVRHHWPEFVHNMGPSSAPAPSPEGFGAGASSEQVAKAAGKRASTYHHSNQMVDPKFLEAYTQCAISAKASLY
mmetsp:Transcript_10348/g.28574  ORF Transcript_10348/g.28574 Transcript_10348/m.28574 type:complete len:259 (+) Transcript_10348:310-1086(+)|eukprot:CAMPEP_0168735466 /NCGR_PEP_ID=MMETSP0724-20121128/9348_1 /TAXON_ID=265536 /ORGANISM="Amphiprora sp., Strain CCMP467" /LENGTH=258 /DNA_ID=CAMNT_0008782611 /DNA_START=350 /DNA_END=1126 /DNA_ORIENTATION=-